MNNSFLCGVIIGLLFGVPAGAVGAMTVQRTLRYGIKEGLLTGLGSSAADCFYAGVGAFGVTLVSDFLLSYQLPINLAGSSLILFMGIRLLGGKPKGSVGETEAAKEVALFASSFIIGITNPAAVVTFLFAFSYFGLSKHMSLFSGIQLVTGVLIGTYLWWGCLTFGVAMLKKKVHISNLKRLNQVFGLLLISFGIVIFARTMMGKI